MDDLISRQAAVDAKQEFRNPNVVRNTEARTAYDRTYAYGWNDCNSAWINAIKALPPAQPERMRGKWIERNPQNSDSCRLIECDQCGFSHIVGFNVPYEHWIENRNFCERCGADMREGE